MAERERDQIFRGPRIPRTEQEAMTPDNRECIGCGADFAQPMAEPTLCANCCWWLDRRASHGVVPEAERLTAEEAVALQHAMNIASPQWRHKYETPELRAKLRTIASSKVEGEQEDLYCSECGEFRGQDDYTCRQGGKSVRKLSSCATPQQDWNSTGHGSDGENQ